MGIPFLPLQSRFTGVVGTARLFTSTLLIAAVLPTTAQTALVTAPAASVSAAPRAGDLTCTVQYRITPRFDLSPRALDVELNFPAEGRTQTGLPVTRWAGITDFPEALVDWTGLSAGTSVLYDSATQQLRVTHPPTGVVQIAYRARGGLLEPDNGKPQTDTDEFHTQIGADWFRFFRSLRAGFSQRVGRQPRRRLLCDDHTARGVQHAALRQRPSRARSYGYQTCAWVARIPAPRLLCWRRWLAAGRSTAREWCSPVRLPRQFRIRRRDACRPCNCDRQLATALLE